MISCLFGRTADGKATSTPAAKPHEGLADWDVFVDLVARTESIVATQEGRKTISLLNHEVYEPTYGRLPKFYQPKVPYSKVLHTFNGDARVISDKIILHFGIGAFCLESRPCIHSAISWHQRRT
jgi:hypothetical protein